MGRFSKCTYGELTSYGLVIQWAIEFTRGTIRYAPRISIEPRSFAAIHKSLSRATLVSWLSKLTGTKSNYGLATDAGTKF